MELTPNSDGNNLIFVGGTGIYPFLDFLDFLLKKSIFLVLAKGFSKEMAASTNHYRENYEKIFGANFKVYLYASFHTFDEFIGICGFVWNLHQINKKYDLGLFELVLRFSKKIVIQGVTIVDDYFDENFFEKFVTQKEINRVFVCGNLHMNKQISEICLKRSIPEDKIYLV